MQILWATRLAMSSSFLQRPILGWVQDCAVQWSSGQEGSPRDTEQDGETGWHRRCGAALLDQPHLLTIPSTVKEAQ